MAKKAKKPTKRAAVRKAQAKPKRSEATRVAADLHQRIAETARRVAFAADIHGQTKTAKSRQSLQGNVRQLQSLFGSTKELKPFLTAAAATSPPEPESVPLDRFLSSVGQALMEAQKGLDNQSAAYLAASAGQKYVQRSVFRIPKMSAEIKFATDTVKDQGMNLFIYKDETKSQTMNQQTVQFDIVSIPPPPDLPPAPFQISLIFAKDRRTTILSIVPASPWGAEADSVLIYEIANGQLLLAYASSGSGNIGFWYVVEKPASAAVLRVFGAQNADAVEPARIAVQMLGVKQKQFLSQI